MRFTANAYASGRDVYLPFCYPKKMKESEIQTAILAYLKARGVMAWRVPLGAVLRAGGRVKSKNPMSGHPDIAAIYGGRYLAIEVKTEKGRVAPHQQQWIDNINAEGGLAFVARSVDDVVIELAKH